MAKSKPIMPVVGDFISQAGMKVVVRAASLRDSIAMQKANEEGSAAALAGLAAFIGACAEIEGVADPALVLTSEDCARVVKLATGGGDADFR